MAKLLIAEDEVYIRFMLRTIVDWAGLGYGDIFEADNGVAALGILRREKPELTLIDIKMPAMNGLEVAERAEEEGLPCDFIVITGYADFSYVRQAVRTRGILDYLLKPIDEQALMAAVTAAGVRRRASAVPGDELSRLIERDRSADWFGRAMQEIDSNMCAELALSDVARKCNVSIGHLSNCIKRRFGVSYTEYVLVRRMELAAQLLAESNLPVAQVAASVGYRDVVYFHKLFKRQYGATPGEYRRRAGQP